MACPNPQPGHQVKPSNFSGHKAKCGSAVGSVNASETSATVQKTSSKYLKKNALINFIRFGGKQHRNADCKKNAHQQGAKYPPGEILQVIAGFYLGNIQYRGACSYNTTHKQYFKALDKRLQKPHAPPTVRVAV